MKNIAFHIQKGGVGKTTLSGNVAFSLSDKGHKTILIDCDPQGNSTNWFLKDSPEYELADVLDGNVELNKAISQVRDNLYLLPTFSIGGDLRNFAQTKLVNKIVVFTKLAKDLEVLGFDYAIYDLSPGMSLLEKRILSAVNEVITPLTPEYFSLDGIEIFNNDLKEINEDYGVSIAHEKIVINNVNKTFGTHKAIMDKMSKFDYDFFVVRQDRKIADSIGVNQSIYEFFPSSKTIPEIDKIANAITIGV